MGHNQKRIREGKIRPSSGQGAHLLGLWVEKEHALFAPGKALRQQRKGVTTKWMKGMGDGEVMLTILATRCS